MRAGQRHRSTLLRNPTSYQYTMPTLPCYRTAIGSKSSAHRSGDVLPRALQNVNTSLVTHICTSAIKMYQIPGAMATKKIS
mmetsp:Transcript_23522/g.79746  ORF Transcript_23522/g.79746 Transcript_23522/m.79746 type:complete len:81 (-) Transcript_23522:653-895(-)